MLRFLVATERDGETLFADTAKAYDELPDAVKEQLEGLEFMARFSIDWDLLTYPGALWKSARLATVEEYPENERLEAEFRRNIGAAAKLPPVVHPAVATHPVSATSGFYCPKVSGTSWGSARTRATASSRISSST